MVPIQTGLEPGWSGSVMAKQLRISPRTKRGQPALLLGVGAELAEDFHVAGVGCLAVDDVMAERALAELFADQGVLDAVEPQPAVRPGDVRGPEAQRLDLLADRPQVGHQLGERLRQERGLEGKDLAYHRDRGSRPGCRACVRGSRSPSAASRQGKMIVAIVPGA